VRIVRALLQPYSGRTGRERVSQNPRRAGGLLYRAPRWGSAEQARVGV